MIAVLVGGGLLAGAVANLGPARARPVVPPAPVASVTVRPGPPILYAPAPHALQLENAGFWAAEPLLVAGASAYRSHEFLHQDHLYDDQGAGATYPQDRARYAGNAADLVEVRMRRFSRALALRLTFSSMPDPSVMAATIALGDGGGRPAPVPHSGVALVPADLFVTWHGATADAVRPSGARASPALETTVDVLRRQVTIIVPDTVYAAPPVVRLRVAAGLWDQRSGGYLPQPACPFFNVAFRPRETGPNSSDQQALALAGCDVGRFFADVVLAKLDGPDDLSAVPTTGPMVRIFPSHHATGQGRSGVERWYCDLPCAEEPMLVGQLQQYSVLVPDRPAPPDGFPVTINLHFCGATRPIWPDVEDAMAARGDGTIVVSPTGRGPCHWWWGAGAADVFEAWADVARRHPTDRRQTAIGGVSMGGYGAIKLAGQYPDLFSAVMTDIGCASAGTEWSGGAQPVPGGEASALRHVLPSLRHVPVLSATAKFDTICRPGANDELRARLDALGYRYDWRTYVGGHDAFFPTGDEVAQFFLANARVAADPARVTFAYAEAMDERRYGLDADHAYWVSSVVAREATTPGRTAVVDVRSHGLGEGDPQAAPAVADRGRSRGVPFARHRRSWGVAPPAPPADVLDVVATNVAELTVDTRRARVSCNPTVNLTSDGPTVVRFVNCP